MPNRQHPILSQTDGQLRAEFIQSSSCGRRTANKAIVYHATGSSTQAAALIASFSQRNLDERWVPRLATSIQSRIVATYRHWSGNTHCLMPMKRCIAFGADSSAAKDIKRCPATHVKI